MKRGEFKLKGGPTTYYLVMNSKTYEAFKKCCTKLKT